MTFTVHTGDAATVLRSLDAESVHCVVTSPPYWGLRDYGVDGQIGLEDSLAEFLAHLVAVFAEVHRVLRKDGTLWVNMGDAYCTNPGNGRGGERKTLGNGGGQPHRSGSNRTKGSGSLKEKDLLGMPWRLAFSLQDAGWYLRRDIIWHKPNVMPESVSDRPTTAHEYLFLLTKAARYHYDADAIREQHRASSRERSARGRRPSAKYANGKHAHRHGPQTMLHDMEKCCHPLGRNRRSVWTIASANYRGAHFATFPPKLVEPCILAGCPEGGVVLDPFAGSGTTGEVAIQHGRQFVGIELNPTYADLARDRCEQARRAGRQMKIAGVA